MKGGPRREGLPGISVPREAVSCLAPPGPQLLWENSSQMCQASESLRQAICLLPCFPVDRPADAEPSPGGPGRLQSPQFLKQRGKTVSATQARERTDCGRAQAGAVLPTPQALSFWEHMYLGPGAPFIDMDPSCLPWCQPLGNIPAGHPVATAQSEPAHFPLVGRDRLTGTGSQPMKDPGVPPPAAPHPAVAGWPACGVPDGLLQSRVATLALPLLPGTEEAQNCC